MVSKNDPEIPNDGHNPHPNQAPGGYTPRPKKSNKAQKIAMYVFIAVIALAILSKIF